VTIKPELPKYKCSAEGCDKTCGFPMLFCNPHWMMVPKALRDDAWVALSSRSMRLHKELARECIIIVNQKLRGDQAA
jgi:hypothetical protein